MRQLFEGLSRACDATLEHAADQLFATLDTTSRKLYVDGQHLVMTDTVGFIRELPTTLIAAFRATLEEALNADLLLHVIDMSSPERDAHIAQVNAVLGDIGVGDVAQAWVYNKCDALDLPARLDLAAPIAQDLLDSMRVDTVPTITLSAKTGQGVDLLRQYLAQAAQAAQIAQTQALAMSHSQPHLNAYLDHNNDSMLDDSANA